MNPDVLGRHGSPGVVPPAVPDHIEAELNGLGDRVVVHDLYSQAGSRTYQLMSEGDTAETAAILGALRPITGPILELAAGAGKLTLPMLARGYEVTALDLSEPMLDLLREALLALPEKKRQRCRIVHGDMTDVDLGERFGAVVLNATSVSLVAPPARRSLFSAVTRHLQAAEGLFVLTTLEPRTSDNDYRVFPIRVADSPHRLVQYWPPGADHRVTTLLPSVMPDTGRIDVFTSSVWVLSREDLVRELHEAGFATERTLILDDESVGRVFLIEGRLGE